nr:hypothetical protein [Acidobacteriota bacterium]
MTVEIAALSSLGLTSFRRNPFAPRFSPSKNASSSSKHLIEGLAAADTALSIKADFMEALTCRSLLLRALAAIEQDPARRRALEADADATRQKAIALAEPSTTCSATNGGVCGGAGNARTISYSTLAAGGSSTITLVAAVSASAGAAATISNTATVISATADPTPANNSATAAVSTPTLTPTGDADGDGLTNEFETRYGLNPFSGGPGNGPGDDPDADGRTNLQEQQDGTHPRGFVITYLAEGATGTFFDTRLAIANPTQAPALVLTRFQKGDGTTIRDYRVLPPMQRTTIDVEGLAGLEAAEFSTLVEADVQVVVDRTMTWDQTGYGSHAERGILTRTATKWYFAEGATFFNFNLFYLIQNPNTQTAQVRVTYLLPSGNPLVKDYGVAPQSRFNIWVDNEGLTDPALAPLANAELSA